MTKTLVIPVGEPGSGKSTYLKTRYGDIQQDNIKYISRDEIRFSMLKPNQEYFANEKRVFANFVKQISEALEDDITEVIIADATFINAASRQKFFRNIHVPDNCAIVFYYFNTKLENSIARNNQRAGLEKVPEEAIVKMYQQKTFPESVEVGENYTNWLTVYTLEVDK